MVEGARYFYPRPPRGGRPQRQGVIMLGDLDISIHALREEGDTFGRPVLCWYANFYPRPPRGGRLPAIEWLGGHIPISIHALREEGDSKNGEKHLRFCFIIKRSAQIWKSLSKNIRKNN